MAVIYSNGGNRWNILGFNFTKRDALSSVYKISMIGIQLPEKYKENSTFRSKALAFIFTFIKAHVILGLRSKRRSSPCILQVVASLSMRIFQLDWNGYI
jgi:hypothetical protein